MDKCFLMSLFSPAYPSFPKGHPVYLRVMLFDTMLGNIHVIYAVKAVLMEQVETFMINTGFFSFYFAIFCFNQMPPLNIELPTSHDIMLWSFKSAHNSSQCVCFALSNKEWCFLNITVCSFNSGESIGSFYFLNINICSFFLAAVDCCYPKWTNKREKFAKLTLKALQKIALGFCKTSQLHVAWFFAHHVCPDKRWNSLILFLLLGFEFYENTTLQR